MKTEKKIEVLSYPSKGEFYNSTFFTTADDLQKHIRIYKGSMENIEGFILMSDGGDDALFDRRKNAFSPAVQILFDWLINYSEDDVKLALFANMEKNFRFKTSDDCSVGILRKIIT